MPFVDDYVHWLNLGTGEVEFRPVESPWTPSPFNWRLHICTGVTSATFRRLPGDSAAPIDLIDIRSATFRMISCLLSALESPERIIITRTNEALEASLSRLGLVFFVNHNSELECRTMLGYVIDEFQSCGTMFGLKNQLVLRPTNGSLEMPRRVIVPRGDVQFSLKGDFASVSIKTETAQRVHWLEYTIDTELGRLTGNVTLQSKLYQCYLHALTSHCLPDPLLGQTGAEESLSMLQSATFLSFQRLGEDDAKLLCSIGDLEWIGADNPSVLSRYHDFRAAVLSILNHANSIEILYTKSVYFGIDNIDRGSFLYHAASRNRVCCPHDLHTLRHSFSSTPNDIVYESRDLLDEQGKSAELAAYKTSWSVRNAQPWLPLKWRKLWNKMQSWGSIGPAHEGLSLRYSRYWLTFDAAKDWLGIYDICQKELILNPQDSDYRITLAFSLSAASFGLNRDSHSKRADIVPLVLIFATDTRFPVLTHPSPAHYDLSYGTKPGLARLQSVISQFRRPMDENPAQALEVQTDRRDHGRAAQKRRKEYDRINNDKAREAAKSIMAQWPKREHSLSREWFDAERCSESVEAYLNSISRNITFKAHIHAVQTILNTYRTTSVTPPITIYASGPQFSTRSPNRGSPKSTPPSLRDVMARVNPPITREVTPPSLRDEVMAPTNPPLTTEGGLGGLIQEFRNSQKSLLVRSYGDDLQTSYDDFLEKSARSLCHGGIPSPPREELRHYRDICSEKKDALFSELSEALAPPSRGPEKFFSISGLWPRITPRSILRELSRDRIDALTDQWKRAITSYAVAFLKYQQSQRMLKLSSRCLDEELLREAENTCEKVAAACSPDWLLIQVSQFTYKTHKRY